MSDKQFTTSQNSPIDVVLRPARDGLRQAIAHHGIDADEVERALAALVSELKGRGSPPEVVVVAVKRLLSEQEVSPDASDAARAFHAARSSQLVHGAIVTLAIAQYYGIRLHATDVASLADCE